MIKIFENAIKIFSMIFILLALINVKGSLIEMTSIVIIIGLIIITFSNKWLEKILNKKVMFFLVFIAIIIKLYYIYINYTIPVSDFATYYSVSTELAKNQIVTLNEYISVFPHVFGYPFILSFVFKLFGSNVLIGQMMNLFIFIATLYFMFKVICKILNEKAAMIAIVLISFLPSYILMSTILCTEFVFIFFFSVIVYLFIKNYDIECQYKLPNYLIFVLIGILLGITNFIRPMVLILLFAFLIFIIINIKLKKINNILNNILICTIIVVPYIITTNLSTTFIGNRTNINIRNKTGMLYSINVGMNEKTFGQWNYEDGLYLDKIGGYNHKISDNNVNKLLTKEIIEKISSNDNFADFFYNKYKVVWETDTYGYYYNQNGTQLTNEPSINLVLFNNANNYYYCLLVFAIISCLINFKKMKKDNFIFLMLITYLLYIGMFLIIEAAPRYHFGALIIIIILSTDGIMKLRTIVRQKVGSDEKVF